MAYDETAAGRVRALLAGRPGVDEVRLMGGLSFMIGGNMCCGVRAAALMIRVGPEAYAAALAEPHVRPLEFGGRRPRGFVVIDPGGYASDPALAAWVGRGLAFVATLPAKEGALRKR